MGVVLSNPVAIKTARFCTHLLKVGWKMAKQFSPHIYPEWGELISDLSTDKQAEIFNAILQYPNVDINSGIWRFIKSQIDRDYEEFLERCKKNGANSRNYWASKRNQSESNDNQSISNDILNGNININEEHKQETETKKKNKQKEKISFSDVFDWESLFDYWESWKKGGRYKNEESRNRMLAKLKDLTGNDFELAKKAICHCIDQGYQGFSNGGELFYKPPKLQSKPPEMSEDEKRKQQELIDKIFGE